MGKHLWWAKKRSRVDGNGRIQRRLLHDSATDVQHRITVVLQGAIVADPDETRAVVMFQRWLHHDCRAELEDKKDESEAHFELDARCYYAKNGRIDQQEEDPDDEQHPMLRLEVTHAVREPHIAQHQVARSRRALFDEGVAPVLLELRIRLNQGGNQQIQDTNNEEVDADNDRPPRSSHRNVFSHKVLQAVKAVPVAQPQ
mmetsp:Transcript_95524/g.270183  ORF Transcript_95524/g.270183 Transcript_95524/m.270183 type:complete len:200 (-) Transcript_95524:985-1584(-)